MGAHFTVQHSTVNYPLPPLYRLPSSSSLPIYPSQDIWLLSLIKWSCRIDCRLLSGPSAFWGVKTLTQKYFLTKNSHHYQEAYKSRHLRAFQNIPLIYKSGPAVKNPTYFPTFLSGYSGTEKRRKIRRISNCRPRLQSRWYWPSYLLVSFNWKRGKSWAKPLWNS